MFIFNYHRGYKKFAKSDFIFGCAHVVLVFLRQKERDKQRKTLSDIVKIKRERADKSKQVKKRNEMEREMCGEQRRRKIRSEDTAHIKRHRCTVGDYISDANGNAGERVFVHIVDIIAFPFAAMDSVRPRDRLNSFLS